MLKQQQTLREPISYKGIGLHTGKPVTMTFRPSDINTGIRFVRLDLPNRPSIQADIDHVFDVSRGTTLGDGDVRVSTVEHVLSALAGLQIDNLIAELDSEEAPVGDGSALPIVDVLLTAGLQEQDSPKDYLIIEDTISYSDKDRGVDIVVLPSDDYRITFMIDYKNPALGTQYTSMYSLEEEFVQDYAPARTFGFLSEVEALREEGLIQGGSLENAIVVADKEVDDKELTYFKKLFGIQERVFVGENGIINNVTLRYENEFVRHKTLDLIGDLFLLGVPLQAHVLAARSGHAANVELVKQGHAISDGRSKDYGRALQNAQVAAMGKKLGVWGRQAKTRTAARRKPPSVPRPSAPKRVASTSAAPASASPGPTVAPPDYRGPVVADLYGMEYHLPNASFAKSIRPGRKIVYRTIEQAERAGKQPNPYSFPHRVKELKATAAKSVGKDPKTIVAEAKKAHEESLALIRKARQFSGSRREESNRCWKQASRILSTALDRLTPIADASPNDREIQQLAEAMTMNLYSCNKYQTL